MAETFFCSRWKESGGAISVWRSKSALCRLASSFSWSSSRTLCTMTWCGCFRSIPESPRAHKRRTANGCFTVPQGFHWGAAQYRRNNRQTPAIGGETRYPHDATAPRDSASDRSEEHTSELQSPDHLVCRL